MTWGALFALQVQIQKERGRKMIVVFLPLSVICRMMLRLMQCKDLSQIAAQLAVALCAT